MATVKYLAILTLTPAAGIAAEEAVVIAPRRGLANHMSNLPDDMQRYLRSFSPSVAKAEYQALMQGSAFNGVLTRLLQSGRIETMSMAVEFLWKNEKREIQTALGSHDRQALLLAIAENFVAAVGVERDQLVSRIDISGYLVVDSDLVDCCFRAIGLLASEPRLRYLEIKPVVSDLSEIAYLTQLTRLRLKLGGIADLTSLSHLRGLRFLELDSLPGAILPRIDLSPLYRLEHLTGIDGYPLYSGEDYSQLKSQFVNENIDIICIVD